VLGLILLAWFTPPANKHQNWNAIYPWLNQRQKWVNRISQSGVLQVDDWELPGGHMIPGGYPTSSAFIRTYDMLVFRVVVLHVATEISKKGIRNPGEEINAAVLQLFVEYVWR